MSTTSETAVQNSASPDAGPTSSGEPGTVTVGGAPRRRLGRRQVAALTVAAVVLAGASVGVAYAASAEASAAAAHEGYQAAVHDHQVLYNAADKAGTARRTAVTEATSIAAAGTGLSTSLVGFVDPATIPALTKATVILTGYLQVGVPAPVESGFLTPTGSPEQYVAAARLVRAETATAGARVERIVRITALLNREVVQLTSILKPVTGSVPAVSATVLAANPLADAGTRATFTTAAAAVNGKTKVQVGDTLTALVTYAAAGHALTDSQAAAVAAQAAAAAAATSTGSATSARSRGTVSAPVRKANGTVTCNGVSYPSYAAAAAACSSGGGSSTGGGSISTAPPVDHTPHVTANGSYSPGCNGSYAYQQSTSSGGGIIINVAYTYTYTTFSTTTGWGLKVYNCTP